MRILPVRRNHNKFGTDENKIKAGTSLRGSYHVEQRLLENTPVHSLHVAFTHNVLSCALFWAAEQKNGDSVSQNLLVGHVKIRLPFQPHKRLAQRTLRPFCTDLTSYRLLRVSVRALCDCGHSLR